jgi:hypothetical protein
MHGNEVGKLPILTNVKCCSCLFYKFSPLSVLSDNNTKMHNYTVRSKKKTLELALTKNFSWQFVRFQLSDVSLKS